MLPRRVAAPAVLVLPALLAAAGLGAHRWAGEHVAYYTGDQPRTENCVACHFEARGGTVADRLLRPRYRSPLALRMCDDGRLLVTEQDAGLLAVVDPAAGRVVREFPVGRRPHGVAAPGDCSVAYVTDEEGDVVTSIDLRAARVLAVRPTGRAPHGVAVDAAGRLFVADWLQDDVILRPPDGGERRILAGRNPEGLALTPDGRTLVVANELSRPARFPSPPESEVTLADAATGRVRARVAVPNAHMLEDVAVTPDGAFALVPLVRPKNLLPALQVERGWMMTGNLGVIDLAGGRIAQLPLDDVDEFHADPAGVAVAPDGRLAFVSHGGVDQVTVLDLPALLERARAGTPTSLARDANDLGLARRWVLARIAVGANPRGLALSRDGSRLYVAERLDDRIGIVDVAGRRRIGSIDLGGPSHVTLRRRGERLFHSASVTLQRQFSCRSCHPGGHVDRLQYDFEPDGLGRGIVDNRSLLGIRDTGPYKWNGRNTSLYMQCGIRFARFLTRSEPFAFDDLNALVAYLSSLPPARHPRRGAGVPTTAAALRGRAIFERAAKRDGTPIPERNRCPTCHPPPDYTDRKVEEVGSATPLDASRGFDTPQLLNLDGTAPYLHDGRALTLEEIWTLYSPDDTHGVTNDLGKDGLNDLVEYLKTL